MANVLDTYSGLNDDDNRRRAAVAIVQQWVGLSWGNPATRAAYTGLILPHDEPGRADAMAMKMSSCGLVAMALMRALGVVDKRLDDPYVEHLGQAVTIVVGLARDAGAWVSSEQDTHGAYPKPGDIAVIGRNGGGLAWGRGAYSAFEHVLTVTDRNGEVVQSVDGGQPGIAAVSRELIDTCGEIWLSQIPCVPDADGRPHNGRRAQGWVDISKLHLDRSPELPPGFSLVGDNQ